MLKFVIGGIVFALIAIAIIAMVIINFTYKGFRKIREDMENNYYRNQKIKEQKEKKPFDSDYFKSSRGPRQSRTQAQYEQRQSQDQQKKDKNPFGEDYFKSSEPKDSAKSNQTGNSGKSSQQQNTARRTTTSSGVTIIDGRDTEEKRKIFDHSDGEYVEFEEV